MATLELQGATTVLRQAWRELRHLRDAATVAAE
jgi:hypothetical protein